MLKAIFQSVFVPHKLGENKAGMLFILRFGWIFITIRWFYYSILFLFRNYYGNWAPFAGPPGNIDWNTYASLQRTFSLPFGLLLMACLATALFYCLKAVHKQVPLWNLMNIMGITFFLPFVLVQPVDQILIHTIGWQMIPVTIVHTIILVWESWAAMEITSLSARLSRSEKAMGISLLSFVWILITGTFWR